MNIIRFFLDLDTTEREALFTGFWSGVIITILIIVSTIGLTNGLR